MDQLEIFKAEWEKERGQLLDEKTHLQSSYDQIQQELVETESIVKECIEDKNRNTGLDPEFANAVENLKKQLTSQQEAVKKYDAKIKKRENEVGCSFKNMV